MSRAVVATVSDDMADVTAMKTIRRMAAPPPFPMMESAAYGNARPEETSYSFMRFGYVGKLGRCSVAAAAKPKVVASTKGIVNQDVPPRRYPPSVPAGSAAIAFWKS